MTPKEKAIELVNKYKNASFNCTGCDMPYCDIPCTMLSVIESKQCGLIAVDEILWEIIKYSDNSQQYVIENTKFWQQVKEELHKL